MTKLTIAMALLGSIGFLISAQTVSGIEASSPQSADPSVGRHLAEAVQHLPSDQRHFASGHEPHSS